MKTTELSGTQREEFIRRLNIETDEMKEDFTALVGTTLTGKGTTVKTLRSTLTNLNGRDGNKITEELNGMTMMHSWCSVNSGLFFNLIF